MDESLRVAVRGCEQVEFAFPSRSRGRADGDDVEGGGGGRSVWRRVSGGVLVGEDRRICLFEDFI